MYCPTSRTGNCNRRWQFAQGPEVLFQALADCVSSDGTFPVQANEAACG
ncbi:MAG: hypothetical protein PHR03_07450 [Desulfovibrionales bacterium]|nr:hypothetical protein [Desulfovibrionales bacterium]